MAKGCAPGTKGSSLSPFRSVPLTSKFVPLIFGFVPLTFGWFERKENFVLIGQGYERPSMIPRWFHGENGGSKDGDKGVMRGSCVVFALERAPKLQYELEPDLRVFQTNWSSSLHYS